jgi:hypothetical protein
MQIAIIAARGCADDFSKGRAALADEVAHLSI